MIVKTECAECFAAVRVDLDAGTATARIPSNGRRGSLHVPAHAASTEGTFTDVLFLWECPACGYADSTYTDPDMRRELS